jgi:hypothetical protein
MIGADQEVSRDVPSQGEEIVLAVDEEEPGAAGPRVGSSAAAPRHWPLGNGPGSPSDGRPSGQERLPALELVAERFAKAVARHLGALPGGRDEARVVETRQVRLDAHLRDLPAGSTLSLITAAAWDHDCALQLDEGLADALLDRVLGGTGATAACPRGRSRTAIEERLLARSIQQLLGDLGRAFTPVTPIEFRFSRFLPATAVEETLGPESRCMTVVLTVPLASGAGTLGLVFPCTALEPVRERLAAMPQSDRAVRDRRWGMVGPRRCCRPTSCSTSSWRSEPCNSARWPASRRDRPSNSACRPTHRRRCGARPRWSPPARWAGAPTSSSSPSTER